MTSDFMSIGDPVYNADDQYPGGPDGGDQRPAGLVAPSVAGDAWVNLFVLISVGALALVGVAIIVKGRRKPAAKGQPPKTEKRAGPLVVVDNSGNRPTVRVKKEPPPTPPKTEEPKKVNQAKGASGTDDQGE